MKAHLFLILVLFPVLFVIACSESNSQDTSGSGENAAQQQGGEQAGPPPAKVGFITVTPQRIAVTNELPGRVVAYRTAEIRPQVSGIIKSRLFKEGSYVEEGQQLYQIDPARYDADYQMAQANLQNARAGLKNAKALAGRYQRLIEANAVSEQEYDNAKAGLDQAKAAVAQAKAEVATAKINLDYTKVYAPISGYISPSAITEGALVTEQQGTALATIRQLDPVYVDLSQAVAQSQQLQDRLMADRLQQNRQSTYRVTLLMGNTGDTYPYEGELDATDLAVDQQTGTIRLRSVFPNPDTILLPGMFVRATLQEVGNTKEIIIPQKNVSIQPDGSKAVWVIGENNQAEKRPVRTGAAYKNNWVILNGLQQGDKVIVEGTMMLREGVPLNPSEKDITEVTGVTEVPLTQRPPPTDNLSEKKSSSNNMSSSSEATELKASVENGLSE